MMRLLPNASHARNEWKSAIQMMWWPFCLSRVWVALWVYVGHFNRPYLAPIAGGWRGVENWWLNPWTTYDSLHYLSIAREGYAPHSIAFFPFYPALLQLFAPDDVKMAAWGIFVSNLAFAGALAVLWRLTRLDWDGRVARRAVWLTAWFPMSVFFSAVYTESVFLLAALCAFWCARTRQFWWAGAWALAAGATRNSGPLLFVALAALWWQSSHLQVLADVEDRSATQETITKNRLQVLAARLWMIGAPLLSFAWVQSSHAARFGALSGLQVQRIYFRALNWPWIPIWRDFLNIISGRALDLTSLLDFSCTLIAPLLVWKFRRQIPLGYALFVLGVITMNLIYARQIPPFTVATTRYMMTTFPFIQMAAALSVSVFNTPRTARIVFGMLAALCALQALQFGLKNFLG